MNKARLIKFIDFLENESRAMLEKCDPYLEQLENEEPLVDQDYITWKDNDYLLKEHIYNMADWTNYIIFELEQILKTKESKNETRSKKIN